MSLVQLFFRESIEWFSGIVSRYISVLQLKFQWPQWLLVWRTISYTTFAEFLYLHFYILIYQPPFVLNPCSIVLLRHFSSLVLVITSVLLVRICLCPFNRTVIFSCSPTALVCVGTSFMLFWYLISCMLSDVGACRLYHVSRCIHSLPKCNILASGGQYLLRILYTVIGIYFHVLLSDISVEVLCTECLILSCHYLTLCFQTSTIGRTVT